MATVNLNEVGGRVTDLRDRILKEWEQVRLRNGGRPPKDLFSTFHDASGSGVKSHDLGRAIDVVTGSWDTRVYLFELGLRLNAKYKDINAIFYPRTYEPHLHVATWSGFSGGSDNSLAVSLGEKSKYFVMKPQEKSAKLDEFWDKMMKAFFTYPPAPGGVDAQPKLAFYKKVLSGEQPLDEDLNVDSGQLGSNKLKDIIKKYWWVGAISVAALVVLVIFKKIRGGNEQWTTQ